MHEQLPLGAVLTAEGDVVIPASRRPNGSTRKPIRIRQGYLPPDEVQKYKTVANRRHEQELKRAAEVRSAVVDELSMEKLSLGTKTDVSAARGLLRSSDKCSRKMQGRQHLIKDTRAGMVTSSEASREQRQQLQLQLTKVKKKLTKMADMGPDSLTARQEVQISKLQQQKVEIIAKLNGATFLRTSASADGLRSRLDISL